MFDVATDAGLPVTFTLAIGNAGPPIHSDALAMVEKANANGATSTGQIFPHPSVWCWPGPVGNPFVMYPSYRAIADPLAECVARQANPEVRQRILNDTPPPTASVDVRRTGFPLHVSTGDPPN